MRSRFAGAIALMALLALPGALFAQSAPAAAKPPEISVTLVYHENNSGTFDVRDDTGASLGEPTDGDDLKVGSTIVTGKGDVAELKLNHTSTIIKVAGNTNFKLERLRGGAGGQDVFSMAIGKVRMVAGMASTKELFQINAGSAVCGVRGSDVVIEMADTTNAKLSALEGTGWIQNAQGSSLDVPQGFAVDTAAPDFRAFQISPDGLQGLRDRMKFTKLDVNETITVNKTWQASLLQGTPGTSPSQIPTTPTTTPTVPPTTPTTTPSTTATTPPAPQTNTAVDNFFTALRNILGMEIGSLTVADPNNPGTTLTYAMAVLEPTFTTGNLKMALYLPVIYQGDMFNASGWYRPAGNDEWSFGRDQSGLSNQAADFTRDLLLKIKYIDYGTRKDPFFLKVGNLDDVTIGHGLVMSNFSNDADFPVVRHVGLSLGVDTAAGGFEALVSDVAPDIVGGTLEPPDIMAARVYAPLLPGSSAKIGVSAIVDLNPARDFVDPANGIVMSSPAAAGSPIFITPGLDLHLPIVQTGFLGLTLFTDGAVLIPYFRSAPTDPAFSSISPGLATKAIVDPTAQMIVKNWGAAAGFQGNLIIPDFTYRAAYQIYTGSFQPQIYDSGYERNRGAYVLETLTNLLSPPNTWNMGIYWEAGFKLTRVFALDFGYFWPWTLGSGGVLTGNPSQDHVIARLALEKGAIHAVNIWGSVSYERMGFASTIQSGGLSGTLFDANTVVSARINYTVNPTTDLSLAYSVAAARDSSGNLVYNGGVIPETTASLSVEMLIHL